jgi:peroxiredoxin
VSDTAPTEISHEEIDGGFVPAARADVVSVEVDGEMVIGYLPEGESHLRTHALNATASIVWRCFDGSGTLDEIVADIADAFGTDVEVVRADVLDLAQQAGALGLLVGVREHVPEPDYEPIGIPVGLPLPPFEATDEHGKPFWSDDLRGRGALLINWSPACGFCARIVDDLEDVVPALTARGIDVVLLAIGDADANRALLEKAGLDCRLLLHDGNTEVFGGMGTPAAYLIDEDGTVVEPMALGAIEVPRLARRAADASAH